MEGPPTTAPVLARWELPPDADVADRIVAAAHREHRRQRQAEQNVSTRLVLVVVGLGWLVMALGGGLPILVLTAIIAAAFGALILVARQRQVRALRRGPSAGERHTVTLDVDGLHLVGPSEAVHLRWRMFQSATSDGDLLLVRRRDTSAYHSLVLDGLGPEVDRGWLLAEVQRLIDAAAPGGPTPDPG